MIITEVTRNALKRLLVGTCWWGDLEEIDFLDRLYDLDSLPSTEDRYQTARQDIIQHREANYDWDEEWIFSDERLGLDDTSTLLKFLAEMVHPAVLSSTSEASALVNTLNQLLQADGWELHQSSMISGRPVWQPRRYSPPPIAPQQLRDAIAEAIAALKAYEVPGFCEDALGLADQEAHGDDPMSSKRMYVRRRLAGLNRGELEQVAQRVVDEFGDAELGTVLEHFEQRAGGVAGAAKNIIFASKNTKPDLVFRDAINNDVEIVGNTGDCLIYDQPLAAAGLSWRTLVQWWVSSGASKGGTERETALHLHKRLTESVANDAEALILNTYARFYKEYSFDIPALLPQVYLHYDPKAQTLRGSTPPLGRQRMDFLLLLPERRRVVIELDGKQHYSDDGRAAPKKYADMVREDRRLRLAGYEVYRFGGYELKDHGEAAEMLTGFFGELLSVLFAD